MIELQSKFRDTFLTILNKAYDNLKGAEAKDLTEKRSTLCKQLWKKEFPELVT